MRLRQWDFSEQRRFPGTKIYTTPANAHQTNKFLSCVLADTGAEWRCADSAECGVAGLMWQIKASTNDFLTLIYKYSKKRPGLIAQGENISAVPPVFRVWLCTLSVLIYCVPVTWNWRWSLLGMSVQVLWIRRDIRFGSLLGGYFHNSFTKARTDRFLSVLPGVVYSSLSWHLADMRYSLSE